MNDFPKHYVGPRRCAALLGVPINWLIAEADARRVPCLRVGRRRLFHVARVAEILAERAEPEGVAR